MADPPGLRLFTRCFEADKEERVLGLGLEYCEVELLESKAC